MKAADVSKRIERLLGGTGQPRDFDVIFLWVRETRRSHGCRIIEDIGDFVAHAHERTKGVSWQRVSQIATIATFVLPRMSGVKNQTLDHLQDAAEASLAIMSDKHVREALGFSKASAKQITKSALRKIYSFDGQKVIWKTTPSTRELTLVERLTSTLAIQPAFSEDDLFQEFARCLLKNGLIEERQRNSLKSLYPFLSLYVTEKMHGSAVALPNGQKALLKVFADSQPHDPIIAVSGTVPIELDGWSVPITFPVFSSSLHPDSWCRADFLVPGSMAWEFPIEIGADWKLRMLP